MLWKSTDEKLEELSFVKVSEDQYGAYYEKYHAKYGYTQVLAITHKSSGKHLIHSYEKELNKSGLNNSIGLSLYEAKLALRKARELGYKINRRLS